MRTDFDMWIVAGIEVDRDDGGSPLVIDQRKRCQIVAHVGQLDVLRQCVERGGAGRRAGDHAEEAGQGAGVARDQRLVGGRGRRSRCEQECAGEQAADHRQQYGQSPEVHIHTKLS